MNHSFRGNNEENYGWDQQNLDQSYQSSAPPYPSNDDFNHESQQQQTRFDGFVGQDQTEQVQHQDSHHYYYQDGSQGYPFTQNGARGNISSELHVQSGPPPQPIPAAAAAPPPPPQGYYNGHQHYHMELMNDASMNYRTSEAPHLTGPQQNIVNTNFTYNVKEFTERKLDDRLKEISLVNAFFSVCCYFIVIVYIGISAYLFFVSQSNFNVAIYVVETVCLILLLATICIGLVSACSTSIKVKLFMTIIFLILVTVITIPSGIVMSTRFVFAIIFVWSFATCCCGLFAFQLFRIIQKYKFESRIMGSSDMNRDSRVFLNSSNV